MDGPEHYETRFPDRPQARALHSLLRDGDQLIIALGEFSGIAHDLAGVYGVHFHLSEFSAGNDDRPELIPIFEGMARLEEAWAWERADSRGTEGD